MTILLDTNEKIGFLLKLKIFWARKILKKDVVIIRCDLENFEYDDE